MKNKKVIVVGGGFFGCRIAVHLQAKGYNVTVLEKSGDLLGRASYANQARVHNGYHYPRSLLTALRSRVNYLPFIREYSAAIDSSFAKYYAVGKIHSKVTARQYQLFCERVGISCKKAPDKVTKLFNPNLVEAVFLTDEVAFDAVILKQLIKLQLAQHQVEIVYNCQALRVVQAGRKLEVAVNQGGRLTTMVVDKVINTTYSGFNQLNHNSNLPLLRLKHELTEMALVSVPDELKSMGITLMCGPFFSLMPFPARKLFSLSHVRYTPHYQWFDTHGETLKNPDQILLHQQSSYPAMIRDVIRYLPLAKELEYQDSIWEVKTVLPASERDDSRPILYQHNYHLSGYTCIMGGKIDNIFDALQEIDANF